LTTRSGSRDDENTGSINTFHFGFEGIDGPAPLEGEEIPAPSLE
jgi:hypothetical protein